MRLVLSSPVTFVKTLGEHIAQPICLLSQLETSIRYSGFLQAYVRFELVRVRRMPLGGEKVVSGSAIII